MDDALQLPRVFGSGDPVLRPPTPGDIERITEICQDPDIQRFTRVPVPYRAEDAEGFVAMAGEALERGSGAHLLVEVRSNVVGCVGVSIDPTDEVGIIGYWTAAEARQRGITKKAVRMLSQWLLDDVGLARLELDAAGTNPASNAVAASLGFTLEGRRRSAMLLSAVAGLPAERVDAHDWGLLPGELR